MRTAFSIVVFFALAVFRVGAAEPVDPFGVAPCLVWKLEPPGADVRHVTKILRRAYALESPFHVTINE